MKTTLLILLLALSASVTGYAQTERGTKMIGGSGAINFNNGVSIYLLPRLGYFVTEDLAVGSGVLLGYSRWKDQEMSVRNAHVGLQPFARYYFGAPKATRVFAQADVSFIHTRRSGMDHFPGYDNKVSFTDTSVGGGIGLVHFLTQQVGLEALVGYRNNATGFETFGRGFGVTFGLQIHLPSAAGQ